MRKEALNRQYFLGARIAHGNDRDLMSRRSQRREIAVESKAAGRAVGIAGNDRRHIGSWKAIARELLLRAEAHFHAIYSTRIERPPRGIKPSADERLGAWRVHVANRT